MAKRKTISVNDLVDFCNNVLAKDVMSPDFRHGVAFMLEHVLHETGNYKGFRYLLQEEVPVGQMPGVRFENGRLLDYPERFENTDDTRKQY